MKLSIKGKNIIDGINENIIKDKVIRINHGHIQEIVNISDFVPDKDEKVYEYQDEIIMPGMIDVHVHLAYSGITSKRAFRAESADLDYTEQALRGYSFALQHMQYGFTSLRDMNAPGRVAISIRNLIDNNNLSGPTIKACGLGLSVTGGHMDQPGWGSHTNFNDMTYPCDGPHEFRKGVRTQFKLGADFIKTNICVSSISDKTKPYRQEMTDDEIETVCSEARLLNLKVASHTSGGRGITVGVKNGLHTVEHGHWLDNETVDLMAKNKTFYVPTLLINEVSSEMSKEEIGVSKSSLTWLQLAREAKWNSLNKAIKANINIAVGTDAGFMLPHGSMNHKEMILLKKGGLNNMQVIKSATQIGAKLLEINAGVIEPGREADILIIKGNPLEDLNVLSDKNNIKVFKKGKLIKN